MNKENLKKVGNMSQLAGITESVLTRGTGKGLSVVDFYNAAGLSFSVLPDRCMDIRRLSYKGMNISFETKNGPSSNLSASSDAKDFGGLFPGGMLYTCGLDNTGVGSDVYPPHGRIWACPAHHLNTREYFKGDDYILEATGDMHQTSLNGMHLCLERTIRTTIDSSSLTITDKLTNFEEEDQKFLLLYHINFGYPFIDEQSYLDVENGKILPVHNIPEKMPVTVGKPVNDCPEECYLFENKSDRQTVRIVNPKLKTEVQISFDTENLPYLLLWKNVRSHDYVLAAEPCNNKMRGREREEKEGEIRTIKGGETLEFSITLSIKENIKGK